MKLECTKQEVNDVLACQFSQAPFITKVCRDWFTLEAEVRQLQREVSDAKCVPCEYEKGIIAGLRRYAWWKDGVQYVGTCGTTLEAALKEVEASSRRQEKP